MDLEGDSKSHHAVSPETRKRISFVLFFSAAVHGFGVASVKTFPESWPSTVIHSLTYLMGSLMTGFLVLKYSSRTFTLIMSFLLKSCLLLTCSLVQPFPDWQLVLLSISTLISSCIDVSMTSWILDSWMQESMDILLGASAFYSSGFVISYFCPMGQGFLSLDKIAGILSLTAAACFLILMRIIERGKDSAHFKKQHQKLRIKDGKIMYPEEDESIDQRIIIKTITPFWKVVVLILISCLILMMIQLLWFNSILMLKHFYIDIGFSVHLPLAEVTLRLLMSGSVLVFILVSRIGYVNKDILIYISLVLILIGTIFLIVTTRNPSLMWASLAFLGFGFSSLIPLIFCVMDRIMNVTKQVTAVLLSVVGFSEIFKLLDQVTEFSRYTFCTVNISICTITIFAFIALTYAERKFTTRSLRAGFP